MKITTKIMLLLLFCTLVSSGIYAVLKKSESKRYRAAISESFKAYEVAVANMTDPSLQPAYNFLTDYTCRDAMGAFIRNPTLDFAENNFGSTLGSFKLDAVWAVDPSFRTVYSQSKEEDAIDPANPMQPFFLSTEDQQALFASNRIVRFFAETPNGLMEIFGATIHPTDDNTRETAPAGYLYAGQYWTGKNGSVPFWKKGKLDQFQLYTSTDTLIRLLQPGETPPEKQNNYLYIQEPLKDAAGKTVRTLHVGFHTPLIQFLKESDRIAHALLLSIFALTGLVIFFFAISIGFPLFQINSALQNRDGVHLYSLMKQKDEFGNIARMINSYFEQNDQIQEMEKEKAAVLDATAESILFLSPDSHIVWANAAAAKMAHSTPKELQGKICHDLYFGTGESCADCPVQQSLKTGETVINREVLMPNGKHYHITARPVRRNGELLGIVKTFYDIKALKETRAV